jgi:hypothetical protein
MDGYRIAEVEGSFTESVVTLKKKFGRYGSRIASSFRGRTERIIRFREKEEQKNEG